MSGRSEYITRDSLRDVHFRLAEASHSIDREEYTAAACRCEEAAQVLRALNARLTDERIKAAEAHNARVVGREP